MKKYIKKIRAYIVAHKVMSIILLIIIILVGYWGYKKITSTAGDTRYLTAKVEKDTIISSVSGSGQVSASNQIEVKSKVAGDATFIGVRNGQKVTAGTLLVQLDSKDANKSIRDAEISLESAKLSLEKLKIQNSNENINADLVEAYNDGFNTVSDAFLDLSSVIVGLEDILGENNLSDTATLVAGKTAEAYREKAETTYYSTRESFKENRKHYITLNNNSPKNEIEDIIRETYETTKIFSDAIKNILSFVDYMARDSDDASKFSSSLDTLSTYTNTINTHLANLLSVETSINDNKDAFPNADLDMQSAVLSVKQKENALQDAKDKLSDYSIRAPFAGTVAVINIKKSDSVNSSTTVATLITKNKLAEISLNEVDVAKVKIGQKTTLTFDAIPLLSISGAIAEIDSIGTVSQGVVTYNVKISFDTQDEQVKPSMSVSAEIITDMKQDVLTIPNSAVKLQQSQNGTSLSYVEMFDPPLPAPTDGLIGSTSEIAPTKIPVEVGLSNDSKTEIISGLKEGDKIVTRTILPTGAKAATAPSIFGSSGGGNRGGAVAR